MVCDAKPAKNYKYHMSQLSQLNSWDHQMKTPHASHEIFDINYKSHEYECHQVN